ncbi:NAD(P)H-dependent oxidoreductase [Plantibacter sp. YIM 135347]|uniref:NAD(P)H-dependent oxidoreductase n=1 Tax=Plantibacter sp. YIM 135347 TaxID=3423919 RepID=UPI003D359A32
MRVLMVFDHPYGAEASENIPHRRSFSAAIAAAARRGLERAGHDVDLIDLHRDRFDPVMHEIDLAAWRQKSVVDDQAADYQSRLKLADHLVFVFPIWWEAMPASTKGFLDKVMTKGIVYSESKPGRPFVNGVKNLQGVTLMTLMTTPDLIYRWLFGNPITKILFRGTFRKIGVRRLRWLNFTNPSSRTLHERQRILQGVEDRFAGM